jgi:radical SAM protein with 4Fe4S-binding SPASM domain
MRKDKIPTIKNGFKDPVEWLKLKKDSNEDLIRDILGNKQPSRTEIEVSFFQLCGLKCAFCWQDHDDTTGIESIKDKAETVIEYAKNWEHIKKITNVTMTGGELFQDSFDKDIYDQYLFFMQKINNSKLKTDINFTLITNLNFNSNTLEKVIDLLKKAENLGIECKLGTSWDPTGRPLGSSFDKNIKILKKYILGITIVLTKPSIDNILRKNNDYLDYLYENYSIDFDYYVPTEYADKMMPSDRDLLNIFRMFTVKYKNFKTVESWLKSDYNEISCGNLNKITILPDGSLVPCRQLDYKQESFNSPIQKDTNSVMINNYLSKYNCLGCEYFNKCTLSCFVMNDHKTYTGKETLSKCLYKILFEELDGSNNKTNRSL